MNKEMKKHLEAVVVAMANEQADEAKTEFSKYLRLKTQAILVGEAEEDCDDEDMKDDKKDDKKEDKKPAFLKDKKDDKDEDKKEDKKDKKDDKKDEDDEK